MIAAISEVECEVDNLWLRGKTKGRRQYSSFGKYMSINYFKIFVCAAPYYFCKKIYQYIDKRDRPWEIFMPCVNKFSQRQEEFIKVVLLIIDKSMSGWRPNTSKLGCLPKYTFEPKKPVPMGTMFRNAVECKSGCLVFQDVV